MQTADMFSSLKKINRLGRCEKTISIFLREICGKPELATTDWINRSLAAAELMSRFAPEEYRNIWYSVGLLYKVAEIWDARYADKRSVFGSVLRKAGFTLDAAECIAEFGKPRDPVFWKPMMAALVYADTHISEKGEIRTSERCCNERTRSGKENKDACTGCMYARYILKSEGILEKCEKALEITAAELEQMRKAREKAGKEASADDGQRT